MVAFRFDCPTFRCVDFVVCGETAAAGSVVEKDCETEGRLLDIDLKALEPGLMANLVAMLCMEVEERSRADATAKYHMKANSFVSQEIRDGNWRSSFLSKI